MNPRLGNGGRGCGPCQVLGTFSCGAISISGGNSCADPTLVDAAPDVCTPASAQHMEGDPPAVLGTVTCFAPNDAGTGVTTDPVTVCTPGCAADYCAMAVRCVLADGDRTCPAGFTRSIKAGTGADPHCASCACQVAPPGPCTGTVTVFDNGTCSAGGISSTYTVGTCNQFSTTSNYNSVLAQLVPPVGACAPAAVSPGTGDAGLTGLQTICCK